MTYAASSSERIGLLPALERQEALETLAVRHFKAALLMEDEEELPLDASFFDIGLTSLRLMDVKQSLEQELGLEIDSTALFNQPTVEQLVEYLSGILEARA
ncbi:acyl carrier protein [Streptomyces sp. XM4193]|uniref:acyl carrier protein n=1 Tax=Streptomyces sp. XM4193 TaxID=2929782 RepID=UPI001FFBE62F|nr:acyl carrier protein [Streptomyces sp. XM4193]MCK1794592.1 acyl carrier protein [Streptomyces sp. XM4193]